MESIGGKHLANRVGFEYRLHTRWTSISRSFT